MVNLYPHQRDTLRYLEQQCANQHGLLVWHHMGTGKTATAVGWLINRKLQHDEARAKDASLPPFAYRIVCPELIRNVWTGRAGDPYKMGFDVDASRVMSYEEFGGEVQSKRLDVRGESVVFDEAHHLVPIMNAEENKQYLRVMKMLKRSGKVLLLTGTPEKEGMEDFMYLVNVAAGKSEFPLDSHELAEEYRDTTVFDKRKKDFYFNWVAPTVRDIYDVVFKQLLLPFVSYACFQVMAGFIRFPRPPMSWWGLVRSDLYEEEQENPSEEETEHEESADNESPKSLGTIMSNAARSVGMPLSFSALTKKLKKKSGIPTNTAEMQQKSKKLLEKMWKGHLAGSYKTVDWGVGKLESLARGYPGNWLTGTFSAFALSAMSALMVTHDPEEAIAQGASIDYDRLSADLGRYVSLYRIPESSKDFATKKIAPTVESLYTEYQAIQQLHFVYGTMDKPSVQYYAGVDEDGAKIKIGAFRTMAGVRKYGRCISNMWAQMVDGYIRAKDAKYPPIEAVVGKDKGTDGTVHYVNLNTKKKVKDFDGCPKFDKLIRMLQDAKAKGERTFIRSEFKDQGIYPLSAYLNSKGIRHYYCHAELASKDRDRILAEFNDVYTPVSVKGRAARLIDYVPENSELTSGREHLHKESIVHIAELGKNAIITDVSGNEYTVQLDNERKPHPTTFAAEALERLWRVRYDDDLTTDDVKSKHLTPLAHKDTGFPSVILFDYEGSEGINLLGVEHVHLLEPMLDVGTREQAVARAVRFQSHRHMAPNRRVVHVHTHIGVLRPSKLDFTNAADMMQSKIRENMLYVKREWFLNKHFTGIVPRTGNLLFDWWRNSVETLYGNQFDGNDSTADMLVMSRLSKRQKYQAQYESAIDQTNVLAPDFAVPEDCEEAANVTVVYKGFPLTSRKRARSRSTKKQAHGDKRSKQSKRSKRGSKHSSKRSKRSKHRSKHRRASHTAAVEEDEVMSAAERAPRHTKKNRRHARRSRASATAAGRR